MAASPEKAGVGGSLILRDFEQRGKRVTSASATGRITDWNSTIAQKLYVAQVSRFLGNLRFVVMNGEKPQGF